MQFVMYHYTVLLSDREKNIGTVYSDDMLPLCFSRANICPTTFTVSSNDTMIDIRIVRACFT
jgi:hypothetical protein